MSSSSGAKRLPLLGIAVILAVAACGFDPRGVLPGSSCQGVEEGMCRRLIAEVTADQEQEVSAVAIRCATGACDAKSGEVTAMVALADGTTAVRNIGWDASGLPPFFPVVPTCEGIKVDLCAQQAAGGWGPGGEAGIVAIHVRCQARSCGPDNGAGMTRVTYRGDRVAYAQWEYATAPQPAPGAP